LKRSALRRLVVVALAVATVWVSPVESSAHYVCTNRRYVVEFLSGGSLWAQSSDECDHTHYQYKARLWLEVKFYGNSFWTKIATTDDGLQTDCCNHDRAIFASDASLCFDPSRTQAYRAYVKTFYTVSTTGNIAHQVANVASAPDYDVCR
jgi:hypothetical protein